MKLTTEDNLCIWPRALWRSRLCSGSPGHKPIRRARCISSSDSPLATTSTSLHGSSANGCRNGLASRSLFGARRAPAAISPPRRSCRNRGRPYASDDGHLQRDQRNALRKPTFNFVRDIAPVASLSRTAGVMEVNPSFPAKTVPGSLPTRRPIPVTS